MNDEKKCDEKKCDEKKCDEKKITREVEKINFPFSKSYIDIKTIEDLTTDDNIALRDLIESKGVYPYKKYYMNINKLINKAKRYSPVYNKNLKQILKLSNRKLENFNKEFLFIESNPDFFDINWITDFFTEECRVKTCRREKDSETPFEYFNRNKIEIATYLENNNIEISYKNLNDFMEDRKARKIPYMNFPPSLCSNYKLSFLLSILKYFKPKRWLDMSAGWGDRLIAAYIYGVDEYYGIDPNICLHSNLGYSSIIDFFSTKNYKTKAYVHLGQAENAPLFKGNKEIKYDFIFTSPPFFTFELYDSDNVNQSTNVYSSIDLWLHNFLFVTINRAWEVLESGGKYLLYIEDKPSYTFIPELKKYMKDKKDCIYNGVIYQTTYDPKYKKNPYVFHTVYCWTKS